jgi:hypothetical protein
MSGSQLKVAGIVCAVACLIACFVTWERYDNNAKKVAASNRMMQSSPLGGMMQQMTGGAELKPAMPTASKYAIGIAVLTAVASVVCFSLAGTQDKKKTGTEARQQNGGDV